MALALLDRPVITDDASRRQFIAGLVAAGLLTACGTATPTATTSTGSALTDDRGVLALPRVPERIVTTSEETTELVVALGLAPVGLGSGRVDPLRGLSDYYLTPEQIGIPQFVGSNPYNLEAIAALAPDLIVHYTADDDLAAFERIAPTAVYEVTVPGAWAAALRLLGTGTGREREAEAAITAYDDAVSAGRERLAAVAARAPRVAVIYPNYRGGAETLVFGEEFALGSALPDLGFTLTGLEQSSVMGPGFGSISTELLGTIEADTVLALGPGDWRELPSAVVLSTFTAPVLGVLLDIARPSAGPLTSPDLLREYVDVLATHYGA